MRVKHKSYQRSSQKNRKRTQHFRWLFLCIGLLLGLGSSYLIYETLSNPAHWRKVQKVASLPRETALASLKSLQEHLQVKPVPEPRFEFYNVLPQLEVKTQTPSPKPLYRPPVLTSESPKVARKTDQKTIQYFVHAAAFSHLKDADALKARLTLQGLHPQILTANASYRIIFGPFPSEQAAENMRKKLVEKQIYSTHIIKNPS